MFYLVIVFVVLVVAWGAARFSILYPQNKFHVINGTSTSNVFRKMLMVPFFQIFGDLFISSQEEASSKSKIILLFSKLNTVLIRRI